MRVVAPGSSLPVQPPDALAAVSPFGEFRLQSRDFSRGLAEAVELVASSVQILLASRGGTGDEVVRADVQSSRFVG
ncbi:hypothetical protein C451_12180 [Halococcus thailandensis JCM 13552]|uniref:Uncharacterized protein n=1 Tax=Halococcus thailandensis JCM 13552 TaxID=1227457 RepID=M0N599_9EURY|nr:hypothetical protein C451_12180 [Halococcus thailandensis JCM 13552]